MAQDHNLKIRQACKEDLDKIPRFYRIAYGEDRADYKFPARWKWLYDDNPFVQKETIPVYLVFDREKIVGHNGTMHVPVRLHGQSRIAAWSIDTVVLPEYRGRGIAKKLQKAIKDNHEIFIALWMNAPIRAIELKLGAIEGPASTLFASIQRLNADTLIKGLKARLRNKLGSRLTEFSWAGMRLLRLHKLPAAILGQLARYSQKVSFTPVSGLDFQQQQSRFGQEVDELWLRVQDKVDFAVERKHEYLNWKFVDQPFAHYQRFVVYRKQQLVGVVIFRLALPPEDNVGIIVEAMCKDFEDELFGTMVMFASQQLQEQGADIVYCATSLPSHKKVLSACGFLPVWSHKMNIIDSTGLVHQAGGLNSALLEKGDHDWDQVPLERQLSLTELAQALKLARQAL